MIVGGVAVVVVFRVGIYFIQPTAVLEVVLSSFWAIK